MIIVCSHLLCVCVLPICEGSKISGGGDAPISTNKELSRLFASGARGSVLGEFYCGPGLLLLVLHCSAKQNLEMV